MTDGESIPEGDIEFHVIGAFVVSISLFQMQEVLCS